MYEDIIMAENPIAPEPLNKLVWRFDIRSRTSPSSVVVRDLEEGTNEWHSEQSSQTTPYTTSENVHIVERYLLEVVCH